MSSDSMGAKFIPENREDWIITSLMRACCLAEFHFSDCQLSP